MKRRRRSTARCCRCSITGFSSAALFFLVGVIYERTHTRNLADYGGLRKIMPIYAGVLGISMFSSLGLPGLNGFVGEFMIFKGAFPIVTMWTSLATIGLVVTAIFLLGMMQKVCFGPLQREMEGPARHDRPRDLHRRGADAVHVLDRHSYPVPW